MATLTELTAEIVSAHASGSSITSEELIKNIHAVYNTLKSLEAGETIVAAETQAVEAPSTPTITIKQAFKKDEVICMICNKGFKTLKRHLTKAHNLKPGEYRKQFGIPSTQSLAAKSYSESRRQMALDKGLGAGLIKFRASEKAKKAAVSPVKAKASALAIKSKTNVSVEKVKPAVPALRKKTPKANVAENVQVVKRVVKGKK